MLDSGQSRYNNTVYKYDNLNNLTACKTFTDKDLILRRSNGCIIKSPTTEKVKIPDLKMSCIQIAAGL